MIAHIGGIPVEEVFPPLLTALGGVVVAFSWSVARVRRLRRSRPERDMSTGERGIRNGA